ncbi:hypothetical protein D6783_04485, partial [Candidatus Woesearchaeota archaeon]
MSFSNTFLTRPLLFPRRSQKQIFKNKPFSERNNVKQAERVMPTQHKKGKKNVHKKNVSQHANHHQELSPMKLRARENTQRQPTILVAGCGFGGLEAAVLLKKKLGENARIICLDRKKHHTYYGAIFEL